MPCEMTWWGNSVSVWGHQRPKGRNTVPWVLGEFYRQLLLMSYISHACNAQERILTILVFESTDSPDNSSFLLYQIHLSPPSFPLRLRTAKMRIHSLLSLFHFCEAVWYTDVGTRVPGPDFWLCRFYWLVNLGLLRWG